MPKATKPNAPETKAVRMLTSAEGEFSLSAGIAYALPLAIADSLLEAGFAELPEDGEKVLTVTPNETAPHHRNDYQEFNPGGEAILDPAEAAKAEARRQAKANAAQAAEQAAHAAAEAEREAGG
jgi:hypothetical protein